MSQPTTFSRGSELINVPDLGKIPRPVEDVEKSDAFARRLEEENGRFHSPRDSKLKAADDKRQALLDQKAQQAGSEVQRAKGVAARMKGELGEEAVQKEKEKIKERIDAGAARANRVREARAKSASLEVAKAKEVAESINGEAARKGRKKALDAQMEAHAQRREEHLGSIKRKATEENLHVEEVVNGSQKQAELDAQRIEDNLKAADQRRERQLDQIRRKGPSMS